ncbi:MAG: hypothetical protein QOE70_6297 [Chthoniobacter sp.]|jgi:hypothetical protein|nr:hypothetical protein [Chthoniobacter sp.]
MGLFDHLFKPKPDGIGEKIDELSEKAFAPERRHETETPAPDPSATFLRPKGYVQRGANPVQPGRRPGGGTTRSPEKKSAVAAPEPEETSDDARDEVVLTLGDVLPRLPAQYLRPGEHDAKREVRFHIDHLSADIARGRAAIALSTIAAQCPDLFHCPIGDEEDMEVRLPLQKLVEQIGRIRARSRPVPAIGVFRAAPAAPVAPIELPKPGFAPPEPSGELGGLPAVAERARAEPAAPRQPVPLPPDVTTPQPAKEKPVELVPAEVGAAKPAEATPVAAPPKPTPPPIFLAPPAARVSLPAETPVLAAAAPMVQAAAAPVVEAANAPVIEAAKAPVIEAAKAPVVEAANAPVLEAAKTPVVEAAEAPVLAPVEPLAPPIAGEKTPESAVAIFAMEPPRFEVPSVREPPTVSAEEMIHLSLAAMMRNVPAELIVGRMPAVGEGTRISLPFAPIERQLGSGKVEVSSERFAAALPFPLRPFFAAREGVTVPVPLEEIFQNLPVGEAGEPAGAMDFLTIVQEKPTLELRATPSPEPSRDAFEPADDSAQQQFLLAELVSPPLPVLETKVPAGEALPAAKAPLADDFPQRGRGFEVSLATTDLGAMAAAPAAPAAGALSAESPLPSGRELPKAAADDEVVASRGILAPVPERAPSIGIAELTAEALPHPAIEKSAAQPAAMVAPVAEAAPAPATFFAAPEAPGRLALAPELPPIGHAPLAARHVSLEPVGEVQSATVTKETVPFQPAPSPGPEFQGSATRAPEPPIEAPSASPEVSAAPADADQAVVHLQPFRPFKPPAPVAIDPAAEAKASTELSGPSADLPATGVPAKGQVIVPFPPPITVEDPVQIAVPETLRPAFAVETPVTRAVAAAPAATNEAERQPIPATQSASPAAFAPSPARHQDREAPPAKFAEAAATESPRPLAPPAIPVSPPRPESRPADDLPSKVAATGEANRGAERMPAPPPLRIEPTADNPAVVLHATTAALEGSPPVYATATRKVQPSPFFRPIVLQPPPVVSSPVAPSISVAPTLSGSRPSEGEVVIGVPPTRPAELREEPPVSPVPPRAEYRPVPAPPSVPPESLSAKPTDRDDSGLSRSAGSPGSGGASPPENKSFSPVSRDSETPLAVPAGGQPLAGKPASPNHLAPAGRQPPSVLAPALPEQPAAVVPAPEPVTASPVQTSAPTAIESAASTPAEPPHRDTAPAPKSAEATPPPAEDPRPVIGSLHLHLPALPHTEPAEPEHAPPPALPLTRFDHDTLQGLFMTEEALDLPKISRLAAALPGIQACVITARGDTFIGGALPEGFSVAALRGLAPQVGAAADRMTLGELKNFTLYGDHYSVSIFERRSICLCAVHRTRSFVPGVREKLVAVADGLARG